MLTSFPPYATLTPTQSETTDMFYTKGGVPNGNHNDINYEVVLRNCNGKLTQWMDNWQTEMQRGRLQPSSLPSPY